MQAAAHGVAQGALAMMQNGGAGFLSGAAGGFFGSLGATAWSSGAGKFAKSDVGTIAFGALSGGVGAELTGGNFWQGAVTGGIVAGLNDVMHRRRSLLSRFKNKKLAFQKADVSDEGIAKLHQNVDGLAEGYAAGNSPTHSYDLEGNNYYAITENGNVNLNKGLISGKNNLYFAGILFHEYRHAFQYFVSYTVGSKGYANRFDAWTEL